MILELDCGNSFIKWRVTSLDARGRVHAEGVAGEPWELVEELLSLRSVNISCCRMVSVRGDEETRSLREIIARLLDVEVICAESSAMLGGVTNGYRDFRRLGLDRWLAVVAAYQLCRKPCVVIDLGTAVTIDLVAEGGRHLGGYITPGIALLTDQLRTHTKRILYDAEEARLALSDMSPGRSTSEAVERGCLKMLRGYIEGQILDAALSLGSEPMVYVTGGDASLFASERQVEFVPDLVFRGLAIACPL